jgi:hypothetical protein
MSARRRARLVPLVLGLLAAGPAGRGQAPAPPPPTAAQQASLDALDRTLGRLAGLIDQDDDARHQATARGTLGELRQRRGALRAAFENSKCEDLKAEAVLDLQREAAWVRSPAAPATLPAQR